MMNASRYSRTTATALDDVPDAVDPAAALSNGFRLSAIRAIAKTPISPSN
jgi:hypothetical protein